MLPTNPQAQDEFTLSYLELFTYLSKKWKAIILTTFVTGALALASTFFVRDVYSSSATLTLNTTSSNMSASGLSSKLGGLASIAGFNLQADGSRIDEVIATATSRQFILEFIHQNNIKPDLFPNIWNNETQTWKPKRSLLDYIGLDKSRAAEPPDDIAFKTFYNKNLSVAQDRKTGLVTLTIRAPSPQKAMSWATILIDEINQSYKTNDIDTANKSLEYLYKETAKETSIEMQKALFNLIQEQKQRAMLANVTSNYIFKIIDPPYLPYKRDFPKRGKVVAIGMIMGCLLCTAFLSVLFIRNESKRAITQT